MSCGGNFGIKKVLAFARAIVTADFWGNWEEIYPKSLGTNPNVCKWLGLM